MIQGVNSSINVANLKFDPENPRVPLDLIGKKDEGK